MLTELLKLAESWATANSVASYVILLLVSAYAMIRVRKEFHESNKAKYDAIRAKEELKNRGIEKPRDSGRQPANRWRPPVRQLMTVIPAFPAAGFYLWQMNEAIRLEDANLATYKIVMNASLMIIVVMLSVLSVLLSGVLRAIRIGTRELLLEMLQLQGTSHTDNPTTGEGVSEGVKGL